MALELRTLMTALLPPTRGINLTAVAVQEASVRLRLTGTVPTAACPACPIPSFSVHSRYQRRLTDLPWGTRAVHIQLNVRTCFCRNRACARRSFTERLPDVAAPYARKTMRLVNALRALGSPSVGRRGPDQNGVTASPKATSIG